MNRYNQQNKLSPKSVAFRVAITLAALFIICWYMPRDDKSRYQFDLGKPWRYSQLIAPYDFAIYKGSELIEHEQDSIMRYYKPYFAVNTAVGEEQVTRFRNVFRKRLSQNVPSHYLTYIESKLRVIYAHGIMSSDDYNQLLADSISEIRIFEQNVSSECDVTKVFSEKTAYEYMLPQDADTLQYDVKFLRRCNLNDYITTNLSLDKAKSEEAKKDLLSSLSYASGMVVSGQKIIDRGDIVDKHTYDILLSLEKENAKRSRNEAESHNVILGQLLFVLVIAVCLAMYFNLFRRDYLVNSRNILFLASMPVIYPLITSFLIRHNLFNVYIIPYSMVPIFIRVFMDSRTAFITHVCTILICSIQLKYPYEFVATQIIAGMVAIYSLRELSQRSQLIQAALYITITSIIFYAGMDLIHEKDFSQLDFGMYIYLIVNGALLLFAYPLLFVFEKTFGFTSNVTLVELSNINNALLRKMSEVAPGTFQHSMQVANIAAAVANKIGAKSQLVRTGALYHDIGKINNPAYFTENQNKLNPHDHLTYEQSAAIVINHIKDGLKLADKYNLPQIIKDFICTHHGKGKTKYFLISFKNQHPDAPIDEALFTYPGPNPSTLEQAILMMADAVEAASRSLPDYSEESISNLVERIIDAQIQEGFFVDCPITFHDISTAKEVFKEKLKTIYHTRVSYPELKGQQKKA